MYDNIDPVVDSLGDDCDEQVRMEEYIMEQEDIFESFMSELRAMIEWAQKYGDLEDAADDLDLEKYDGLSY